MQSAPTASRKEANMASRPRPLPQLPIQLAAVGSLLGRGAAALSGFGSLHHCAPGGWRLSSMSRI